MMRAPEIPADWPNRAASRHIPCAPHLWHIQDIGAGPLLLLIHGAGGASHSFRQLIPLLTGYRMIAIDLPGQGFSVAGAHARVGLDDMARDIAALCAQENWSPIAIIGHSAGAAIALRLAGQNRAQSMIGINAALGPFEGVAGWLFPAMARFLTLLPFLPQVFCKVMGTPAQVNRLLLSTGSRIDAQGAAQYLHLMRRPAHVSATLAMMAQWQLDDLLRDLPQMPALLITAGGDLAVPPAVSDRAAARMTGARRIALARHGHLVHEEAAAVVAAPILEFLNLHAAPRAAT